MSDRINELPDDILRHIFSFLTLRDAARTRSLTYNWRFLHDTRSTLHFDTYNVFGKEPKCYTNEIRSKFVAAINQFMKSWKGTKIRTLHVNFDLRKGHTYHVISWIETAIKMGSVEEVHLDFFGTNSSWESCLFPCYLNNSSLKCLRLKNCKLHGIYRFGSWLNHLTILDLSNVPLYNGVKYILSGGSKLITSLSLSKCTLPREICIDGQLHCLKNLVIDERLLTIKLDCPNLESFKYYGQSGKMIFVHVPKLKKVDIWFSVCLDRCSELFDNLTRNVPQLEDLSLRMMIDVSIVY